MKRVHGIIALLVGWAIVITLGCSSNPPPIREAKAIESDSVEKPVELAPQTAPAQSDPAAQAIVEDALKAHSGGNRERLQKLRTVEYTREGQGSAGGQLPVSQKWLIHAVWPNKIRFRLDMPNQPAFFLCRDGDKVWNASSASPKEEPALELARDFKLDATSEWLWMLFPLMEPNTIVARAPDVRANDRPALGVRVWTTGVTDAILHFDQETKLLVRLTYDGRESRRKVTKELVIQSHKAFEGLTLPDKMILKADGSTLAEWNTTAVDIRSSIDPKVFENP